MERRAFLRKLSVGTGIAAVPVAISATRERGSEAFEGAQAEMKQRFGRLEGRFEQMEASHKKTLKLVAGVAALSLGMDLGLLI